MKKLCLVLMALFVQAHAATFNIAAGASTSSISSTISSAFAASTPSTVQFAPGTYSITSTINLPCPSQPATILGAALSSSGSHQAHVIPATSYQYPGPQLSWTQDPYTTKLVSTITNGWQFSIPSGCTTGITIANIEFNGNQPSGGGGGSIHFNNTGGSNVTLVNNWFHGSWANTTTGHTYDAQIFIDGSYVNGGQIWTNVAINWNNFGASTDCNLIMNTDTYQGGNYDSHGGYCDGLAIFSSMTNPIQDNNAFYHMEQCTKGFVGGNAVPNVFNQINGHYDYNDCGYGHRNPWEFQLAPQSQTYEYNSFHDAIMPGYTGFVLSAPQGPTYNVENNVLVNNTSAYAPGNSVSQPNTVNSPAICECWGNGTFKNNLSQGITGTVVTYGYEGPLTISGNISQMPANVFLNPDASPPPNPAPTVGTNTQTTTITPLTSVLPTISPAAGSKTYPLTVTLSDPGLTNGVGPQGNTGVWYTTDGSTPTPGTGTATRANTGDTISLSGPATVKAVGMWGSANQPASYASGYGFVPSAVASTTYTSGLPVCATLPASPSQATVQSALNSCGSGKVLQMVAGTTSVTSSISIPCGVSLVGAPFTWTYPANSNTGSGQTTVFSGSTSLNNFGFQYPDNCTATAQFANIEWNGNKPSAGGGGALYIGCSVQNYTVTNNYLHGAQANTTTSHDYDGQVRVDCGSASQSDTPDQVTISWNIFGASPDGTAPNGDCGNISQSFSYQGGTYDSTGGDCNGIGFHEAQVSNTNISNNIFRFLEQGMKLYECGGGSPTLCIFSNVNIQSNDFSFIHRIFIESQVSPNPNTPPGITYTANVLRDAYYPNYGSWGFSQANIGYNYDLSNLMIANNPPSNSGGPQGGAYSACMAGYTNGHCIPGAYEFWANAGNNSLAQGYWFGDYAWGYYVTSSQVNYNTYCGYYVTNYGTFLSDAHGTAKPSNTGNVGQGVNCSQATSASPTITPASGTQSYPLTVNIVNNGFGSTTPLPNANTSTWCTTDGSAPTPGSGTAVFYDTSTGPQSLTLSGPATVKCAGMWGAKNQLRSYANVVDVTNSSNHFGFIASPTVSAAYTGGGTSTVATPVISPATGTYPGATTITITTATSGAAIHYTTDGTTPTSSSPTYSGGFTVTPTSGSPVTVQAIGILSGYTNSAVASNTYTYGIPTVATPTFTPAAGNYTGSPSVTIATTTSGAALYYTTNGSTPTTSSTPYTSPFALSGNVTVKAIGVLSGYNNSAVGTAAYTYTTPTITSCGQSNVGNINTLYVGQTAVQQQVVATYNDGTQRTLPDAFGNNPAFTNNAPTYLNVTSGGLISCIAVTPSGTTAYSEATGGTQACYPWGWTCSAAPSVTLTSVTLSTTGSVSSIPYQGTNQIIATCGYSDSSTTNCTTTDSHGNSAGTWASSSSNVTISGTGLATGAVIGSSNLTAKAGGLPSNALVLGVTSQKSLTGVTLTAPGGATSIGIGNTLQFTANCAYSNAATTSCSTMNAYGDAVTTWKTADATKFTMSSSGLATGVAAGTANAGAVVNGVTNATAYPLTVNAPTLTGLTLATTGGITSLAVGSTNQLIATCAYSDGTTTNCTTTDSHGNIAGTWTSTTSAHATVSGTGLCTGVGAGTTTFTAQVGSFTSTPALPLTITAVPTGFFTITIGL